MTTPSPGPGNPWTQPGDPAQSPAEPSRPSTYGTPSSPSYGKYGQGVATAPVPPSGAAQAGGPPPAGPPPGGPQWGQPGYSAPQPWASTEQFGPTALQRVGRQHLVVIGLSVLLGVALCVGAAVAPNQNQQFRDAFNGVATQPQTEYNPLSSLALLLEIVVWVMACVWLTRIRQNALVLQPRGQRRSDVWVWLGWVVPIVNFWFPKQIVDDSVTATASASGSPRIGTGFWWAAWLSSMAFSLVLAGANLFPPNETVHTVLVAGNVVVTSVALVLWIRIVRWLSTSQDALVANGTVGTSGSEPPTLQG